jgi:hypothetical protein
LPGLHLFLKNKSAFTAQPLANRLIKANWWPGLISIAVGVAEKERSQPIRLLSEKERSLKQATGPTAETQSGKYLLYVRPDGSVAPSIFHLLVDGIAEYLLLMRPSLSVDQRSIGEANRQ